MATVSVEEHRVAVAGLLAGVEAGLAAETIPLSAARIAAHPELYLNRVLAADLAAPTDLPPFDNSQMDGYAVRSRDLASATADDPVELHVGARVAAGSPQAVLSAGWALPVMTGAPLPEGADAVIPIEAAIPPHFPDERVAVPSGSGGATADSHAPTATVRFTTPVAPEQFVRRRGSDVRSGHVLLAAGTRLGPAQWGVISASGAIQVTVVARPRVLVIATGHEIREPGSALEDGQIFDSNSTIMSSAVTELGCSVVAWPCRTDDAHDLLHIIASAGPTADLVITIGGVSAGTREVVRDALEPLGVVFRSVAMQPGGPQGFGVVPRTAVTTGEGASGSIPIIAFPGNPVSALVSFEMFVRPVLARISHHPHPDREVVAAPLREAVSSPLTKHQIRRGALDDDGSIRLIGGPSSHLLHAYASASILVHLPADRDRFEAGEPVVAWRIND